MRFQSCASSDRCTKTAQRCFDVGDGIGSKALVPGAGIEPAWGCPRRILSHLMQRN